MHLIDKNRKPQRTPRDTKKKHGLIAQKIVLYQSHKSSRKRFSHDLKNLRKKTGNSELVTLENSKAYQKEHGEKAEVTEKYVERTGNATKLDLIFFARKEESCG